MNIRKQIIIILFFVFTIVAVNAQELKKIQWHTFEEAISLNTKNPKLIFIDVYTEWCGWCKKMDASTFVDPAIVKYMNENYYCVKLDAEQKEPIQFMGKEFVNPDPEGRRSTHQLAALLLNNKMSYPSYAFMNGENKMLTVVNGFMNSEKLNPIIHWFGEGAYLHLSYQDYLVTFNDSEE